MDWKEWGIIGFGTWWMKSKLEQKIEECASNTDENRWEEMCQRAADMLQRCLADQSKPSWYYQSSDREAEAFCHAVRQRVMLDGNPMPETEFGENLFDALSLSFAHAMELVDGDKAEQVRFAAKYHAFMINQKGTLVYDEPSACL